MSSYDLLVIGGGINGLGIAADASARGLAVLLVEKGDFGAATTAASSRLIHGGLRYLQYGELSLVRESLHERGLLVRQRPHLVRPIRLLIPALSGAGPPSWKLHAGLKLYDLLARDSTFPHSRYLPRADVQRLEPGLSTRGLQNGFLYSDGQIEFPERLCVELMRETVAAGSEALNHTRVISLRQQGDRVNGARLQNELTGQAWDVEARLVINAAGPWVDAVNRLLPTPPSRLIGGTWGTHVVLPPRPEGPRGHLYATAQRDGRPFFILPWDGRLLVGTTDVPFEGDPDRLAVQAWEVEYLLSETNRLFPGAGYAEGDVQHTTIGIRPLPASDRAAGAITRRHFLVDHRQRHGISGLASVVGGKLTTYRSLAEEVVDWCCRELGRPGLPCPTRALPVGSALPETPGLSARSRQLYGPRAGEVERLLRQRPEFAALLLPNCSSTVAEVVYAAQEERARTVDDVLRRRLLLLPVDPDLRAAVRRISEQWRLGLV